MKGTHIQVAVSLCLWILCILYPTDAPARGPASSILSVRSIKAEKRRTPEYRIAGGAAVGRKKDWMMITTEYDTAPDWVDQLDFTYYVVVQGVEAGREKATLFTGTVSYINVERGRRHRSAVFIHPSTLKRYGAVEAIAVQIKHQGRVEAIATEPAASDRWWERYSPREGYLLNRMETPFAMMHFDDYEAIKGSGR